MYAGGIIISSSRAQISDLDDHTPDDAIYVYTGLSNGWN